MIKKGERDMEFKNTIILLILAIFLFSITGVCASEIDNQIVSEDTNTIGLSSDNDIIDNNLQTSEKNDELTLTDNDETLNAKNDTDVLGDNPGTYSGLSTEIGSGGNIELQHDYYTYDTGNTISISVADSVIDGKGAIIDMVGSNIRAFYVSASRVTIKNLTIKNANYTGWEGGGAIRFSNSGTVTNCNFINNKASDFGGAVCFDQVGTVSNCNFTNNSAYIDGGAIYFSSSGTVSNCNFTDNHATGGGAVYFDSTGTVTNCNFTNNTARYGGAIDIYGTGTVINCNFANNSASFNGGAVEFYNGTVRNCNFINNTATNNGGAVYLWNGTVRNCNFINNTATNNGGAVYFDSTGTVRNCNFINNTATNKGGAVSSYTYCEICSSIFLLNKNTFNGNIVLDNCFYWFGNNASNYETKPYNFIDSWLFLDATISPVAGVEGKSSIVFNLKLYNSTSKSITIPDIPNLPDIIFDLSATNGYLSKYSTRLGEPVIFTSTIDKDGTVKASYYGATYSVTFSNLNLEAPDVNKYYNGSERFIVTLSDSSHKPVSNKNVSITMDGKTTTGVTDGAGQFSIPLDLDSGNYIVTSSYTGLIVISNVNIYSTVEFSNVKGVYNDVTFNTTILDSAGNSVPGQEVKIKVGNIDYTAVSDSNGVVRISPELNVGNYVMTITNPVTGEVKSNEVVISKAASTINIRSEPFAHGVTLTANMLPGNISGEVIFTINGNQYYSEDVVNSKASITLRNLDSGKYTAVVTFNGNTNYNASSSSQITFDVDEYDYVISAPDVTKNYGGSERFNITLTKNNVPIDNANVIITINGVNYNKNTDNNGKISIDINNLDAGIYGVVVKYNSITANSVIIVNQLSTNIDLSFVKHSSDNVTLTAKITPSVTGELVFTVKGKDYKVNITAGKALLNLAGLDDGNYSANAVYKGAVNYKPSTSNSVSFIIDKNSIFIYAPEVTKEYGGSERFNITLTRYNMPVANVNVEITIDGIDYNEITDNEGKISMNISDLNVGVHEVVVKYDSVSAKSIITVNLVSTKISWSPNQLTTVYNVNKNLVATLIDSSGNPIVNSKVTIMFSNGKTLNPTTNAKGQVTISTNGLTPVKTYTSIITFAGNAIYKKSTATVKITVKKATPKLTAKKKTFKKSVKVKKYTIVLKDNLGKAIKKAKVTIKVGKKTYTAKTNVKGEATFKIKKLTKKGTYKATITYKGNAYYNKVTKDVKIKLK